MAVSTVRLKAEEIVNLCATIGYGYAALAFGFSAIYPAMMLVVLTSARRGPRAGFSTIIRTDRRLHRGILRRERNDFLGRALEMSAPTPLPKGLVPPDFRTSRLLGIFNTLFASEILLCGLCMCGYTATLPLTSKVMTSMGAQIDKQNAQLREPTCGHRADGERRQDRATED